MKSIFDHNILKIVLGMIFFMEIMSSLYAQTTFKVTYSVTEARVQGSLDDVDENSQQLLQKMITYTKNVNYILITNQEESCFEREKALKSGNDSPLEHILERSAQGFTSFNEKVYTNHETNRIVFARNIANQDFTVKRKHYNFNWNITHAGKQILGLEANKAEGTYLHPVTNEVLTVEAWFIPSIPLQSGPDIFMGLPGLIAEVNLKGAVVTMSKIEPYEGSGIKKIDDAAAMSQEEFEGLIQKLNKKFEEYFND